MNFIDKSAKTNWKYIAIVGVLGLVVGGGISTKSSPRFGLWSNVVK